MKKGLEPKLIPYEKTMYDILIKEAKGKYFQSILSNAIIQIPEENSLNIHYVEGGNLSVWYPLINKWGNLSLDDFPNFALISEEQFKNYQNNPKDVFGYLLVHKDSKMFKENNKANLSAEANKSFGIVVDKSKATRTCNMRITPFSKNSRLNH